MRYELTDLKLFLEIAQAHSLSVGASAVHITASSASYRLKNLEQALGTALFTRTPRGMDLTPAGEAVLAHAREVFEGLERMHGEVGRFISGLKGHVRLAANSSALNGFATASIGRFLVLNPDVDADIEERQSETIPSAVLAREVDIGIFAGPTEVSGLELHRYAMDKLVIAVPSAHVLADEQEVKLGAALEFDFVCMSRASSNFLFLRDTAQRVGKPLRTRLHAHSFEAVLSLVAAGLGIALVPTSVLIRMPVGVSTVPLAEAWALRELNLAVRAESRLPSFAKALVQFLLEDPRVAITREER
ncbi:MAG: LysR family transcriptional regulator [Burkholderiaceae bacterium]|jgi:DNA-binding transcriptional LysR family regulator|nr:LysR family transcriptional regulator [Burkholderiaceae bacterium]